jgi:hypothetical protein
MVGRDLFTILYLFLKKSSKLCTYRGTLLFKQFYLGFRANFPAANAVVAADLSVGSDDAVAWYGLVRIIRHDRPDRTRASWRTRSQGDFFVR